MTGGTVINDERELRECKETLEGEGLSVDELAVGDHVEIPPCVSQAELEEYQKEHGQDCPRVVLSKDNGLAWQLVQFSLNELSRPCVEAALSGLPPATRAAVALRVGLTLQDGGVLEALEERRKELLEERRRRG